MPTHGRPMVNAPRATVVLIGLLCSSATCQQPAPPPESPDATATRLRDVRVLVLSGARRARISLEDSLIAVDENDSDLGLPDSGDWVVIEPDGQGGIRFEGEERSARQLSIRSSETGQVSVSVHDKGWQPTRRYWGSLQFTADESGRLRGINHVDVEHYIACVVAYESWPTFKMAAVRAQSIASRTFVIDQMIRRNRSRFDVSATQASQVYRGIRADDAGHRAAEATSQTRGVVCAWRDGKKARLFPAYYSAACGGMSQSGAIFGSESDVEPLSGGVRCDYCRIAPRKTYRWGPVRVSLAEVRSKLRSRFKNMSSLVRIDVTKRTPSGRPITLRLTDASHATYDIQAERLRHALGSSRIRSTNFKISVSGRDVLFSDGRGFGHGLGMCQWGAEGLAREGKKAGEILRYYYPGCLLSRVY